MAITVEQNIVEIKHAPLLVDYEITLPPRSVVYQIAAELESEFTGRKFSVESVSEFTEELKRRIMELTQIKFQSKPMTER